MASRLHRNLVPLSLLLVALSGCGGAGSANQPIDPPSISDERVTKAESGTAMESASPSPGTTQLISVNVDGQTISAEVPGGQTISAGQEVVVIPATFPLNLSPAAAPTRNGHLQPGAVFINFEYTGININNGQLVGQHNASAFAIPRSSFITTVVVRGPLSLQSTDGQKKLTISSFLQVGAILDTQFLPEKVEYSLPANGESFSTSYVHFTFGSRTSSVAGRLDISLSGGMRTQQAGPVKRSDDNPNPLVLKFANLKLSGSDMVPKEGVEVVKFSLYNPY